MQQRESQTLRREAEDSLRISKTSQTTLTSDKSIKITLMATAHKYSFFFSSGTQSTRQVETT